MTANDRCWFLIIVAVVIPVCYGVPGQCIWYGVCSTEGPLNCKYDGPAKPLNDTKAVQILRDICPQYAQEDVPSLCCDAEQIHDLNTNLAIAQKMLARCPSCFQNFRNIFCPFTCAPEQSVFMRVTDPASAAAGTPINAVEYVISANFSHGMFNSCRSVQMPSSNSKALSTFCGKNVDQCSVEDLFSFIGTKGNPMVPFQITYIVTDEPYKHGNVTLYPRTESAVPCNRGLTNTSSACSCQDCDASCSPPPPAPLVPPPWTILGVDGLMLIMFCVFGMFLLVFGSYQVWYHIVFLDGFNIGEAVCTEDPADAPMQVKSRSGRSKRRLPAQILQLDSKSPSKASKLEQFGALWEKFVANMFREWGRIAASYPYHVLAMCALLTGILACGLTMFTVTTDPVQLWSSPDSRARLEKDYFDENFAPFYRIEQLIIRPKDQSQFLRMDSAPSTDVRLYGPALRKEFLHQILSLQLRIEALSIPFPELGRNISLRDICFAPLYPDNTNCTIMSVVNYFQNDPAKLDQVAQDEWGFFTYADYVDHISSCISNPSSVDDNTKLHMPCLGTYGGPIFPNVALGGFKGSDYMNATAMVITFSVNNTLDHQSLLYRMALAWEKAFIHLLRDQYVNPNITISFSSERSIEDELDRESSSDVFTILLSYLLMFAYISVTLGQMSWHRLFLDSKITLGLCGVLIVLLSVVCSLGVFSYAGLPASLIIIEVVPFLVLAVGVDNIFILVQTYQRTSRSSAESPEQQIGRVLAVVGPSMLLTSLSESVAFMLGALTSMPAVKMFSLYAGMAVLFDFFFQITAFVSLMALDARRHEANRYDVACCLQPAHCTDSVKSDGGYLYSFFKKYFSRFLMADWTRAVVMVIFVAWFCMSTALVGKMEVGLDQKLSMPHDSYVLTYFESLADYLHVGPPVYFVVEKGHDYTSREGQNQICGTTGCNEDSLLGQIYTAAQRPLSSSIAQSATSWIDDYFDWISPGGNPSCCRLYTNNNTFCSATVNSSLCAACPVNEIRSRPSPLDFMRYLPWYLADNPTMECPKGGHAAYNTAVQLLHNKSSVGASYFMTYHTILRESSDYIRALKDARMLADNITRTIAASQPDGQLAYKVFPYSIFYVFYEQYLFIVYDTTLNLSLCAAAIFLVTFVLLGFDFWSAAVVLITIVMIVVDIMAMMVLWSIPLNAIALVNLVMAVGIAVEFCSHIVRAFTVSLASSRVLRAKDALANMGSSVFCGITLTKFVGIFVLAFSKSRLFQIFYFRMYLGIVLFGATHGLVFLPVLLSYLGPPINKAKLYDHQCSRSELEKAEKGQRTTSVNESNDRRDLVEHEVPPSYDRAAAMAAAVAARDAVPT